jgi:predicted nucleic acid-binding protein
LDRLLEEGPPPATAAIIVQEYLQGLIEPGEFALAESALECFDRLPPPDYSIHLRAAENHVKMKARGVTIPTVDTLIVTMAYTAACTLLTRDRRQRDLARFLKVKLL